FRGAGGHLATRHEDEQGHLYRSAPLPEALRRAPLAAGAPAYDPAALRAARPSNPALRGASLGGLLRPPPPIDLGHMAMPRVALSDRLAVLRGLLRRGTFSLDDAVRDADRMTVRA